MREIEVKFPVKDHRYVKSALEDAGACLMWKGVEESLFFDTPDSSLKQKHQMLRLRRYENSGELTFKSPPRGKQDARYKVRREYQIDLPDLINFKDARSMLLLLGFYEWFHYKKYREHWLWNDPHVKVELDRLNDGRHFVEIEGSRSAIRAAAVVLGLDWKQATIQSYVTLLQTK